MTKVNAVESLKFLSETHRALHAKRQQYEWRILFTILTFYVLSVAAVFSPKANIPDQLWFSITIWCVFILLSIISSSFLWCVHKANAKNKSYAEEAERKLIEIMNTNVEIIFEPPGSEARKTRWAFAWQISTLFLVATAAATLITSRQHL